MYFEATCPLKLSCYLPTGAGRDSKLSLGCLHLRDGSQGLEETVWVVVTSLWAVTGFIIATCFKGRCRDLAAYRQVWAGANGTSWQHGAFSGRHFRGLGSF